MNENIQIVHPTIGDAKCIYNLIKKSKPLDVNSQYLYMLQTTYFNDTCIVAKQYEEVVGFVSGFIHPKDENIFFVWQVAVDSNFRGQNIAFSMLKQLFESSKLSNIKYIHTTISPSNIASQKVFEKFAKIFEFDKEISIFATKDYFEEAHEDELLYMMKPKVVKDYL